MPVEAPGVGQAGHAGGQGELAQRQLRAGAGAALLPRPQVGFGGGTDQRIVEGRGAAVHDEALAARVAERDLRPGRRAAIGARRQHQFRAPLLMEFDREHPAQTGRATALEHDVPAGLASSRPYSEAWKVNRRPSTDVASGSTDASISRRASRKLSSCRLYPEVPFMAGRQISWSWRARRTASLRCAAASLR